MRIMAVDLGDVRTGLALSDITGTLASPIGVVEERNFERLLSRVADAAKENRASSVVVGHPKNMNGTLGERAEKSELFARRLGELIDAPVVLWDERGTTVSAIRQLNETNTRGQKRKKIIDAVAAVIILESYLAYVKGSEQLTVDS